MKMLGYPSWVRVYQCEGLGTTYIHNNAQTQKNIQPFIVYINTVIVNKNGIMTVVKMY